MSVEIETMVVKTKTRGMNTCDACGRDFLVFMRKCGTTEIGLAWLCPNCHYDNKPWSEGTMTKERRNRQKHAELIANQVARCMNKLDDWLPKIRSQVKDLAKSGYDTIEILRMYG